MELKNENLISKFILIVKENIEILRKQELSKAYPILKEF